MAGRKQFCVSGVQNERLERVTNEAVKEVGTRRWYETSYRNGFGRFSPLHQSLAHSPWSRLSSLVSPLPVPSVAVSSPAIILLDIQAICVVQFVSYRYFSSSLYHILFYKPWICEASFPPEKRLKLFRKEKNALFVDGANIPPQLPVPHVRSKDSHFAPPCPAALGLNSFRREEEELHIIFFLIYIHILLTYS